MITERMMVDFDLEHDTNGQLKTDTGLEVIQCGPSCARIWTGRREAHCSGCHLHFSSDSAFDVHRNAAPSLGAYSEAALCKPETQLQNDGRLIKKDGRFGSVWGWAGSWGGPSPDSSQHVGTGALEGGLAP